MNNDLLIGFFRKFLVFKNFIFLMLFRLVVGTFHVLGVKGKV